MIRCYTIHGFLNFSISGTGDLFDYLAYQFRHFELKNIEVNSDLNINILDDLHHDNEVSLKDDDCLFSLENGRFYFSKGGKFLTLNGGVSLINQKEITFESSFPKTDANLICDLIFRANLLKSRIALVHASCIARGKDAVLIPAWKSTGKTTLSLKMVKNGFSFLGDDKVWISENGKVFSYPRYIVIKESNADELREIIGNKAASRYILYKLISGIRFFPRTERMLWMLRKALNALPRHCSLEELLPGTEIQNSADLSGVFYLVKSQKKSKAETTAAGHEEILNKIASIDNSEWNYELLRVAAAHDILFSNGPGWTDEIMEMIGLEKGIIKSAISKAACYRTEIPAHKKSTDWNSLISEIINRIKIK